MDDQSSRRQADDRAPGVVVGFRRPEHRREPWLSQKQAAEHLGVSVKTLRRWQTEAGLPVHSFGRMRRYRASELDAWLTGDGTAEGGTEGGTVVELPRRDTDHREPPTAA